MRGTKSLSFTRRSLEEGFMEKEKNVKRANVKAAPRKYSKPKVKKHENLKEITLLSFTPPGE
jgi:hypothetical protein